MSADASQRKRLRILLVTQWFDPEPTFKGLAFAKALQNLGHEILVATGFPNYPGGKIYPGHKLGIFQKESSENVNIARLFLFPSHSQSGLGRVFNYVSFFFSTLIYLLFFAPRVDVIYVYHPPATVGLAAAISKFFRRTPTVLDVQDMWPDTLQTTGMINNVVLLKIIGHICDFVYAQMNHIVVLSNGFKTLLQQRKVNSEKITVIPNWADIAPVQESERVQPAFGKPDEFKVLFAGNMGLAQGLDAVLDAAKLVSVENQKIHFYFLGDGISAASLKTRCANEAIVNVTFLPRVPMQQVGSFLRAADALLVHLKDDPLFRITIPSKTQAYLAVGKPILMAVAGEAADMIKAAGAGVCIAPENPKALADAILEMTAMKPTEQQRMGLNGIAYYHKFLSISVGARSFESIFLQLARP